MFKKLILSALILGVVPCVASAAQDTSVLGMASKQFSQFSTQAQKLVSTNPGLVGGLVAGGVIAGIVGYETGVLGKARRFLGRHKQLTAGILIGSAATLAGIYYVAKDHPRSLPEYLGHQLGQAQECVTGLFKKS